MAFGNNNLNLALKITADSKQLDQSLTASEKKIKQFADTAQRIGKTMTVVGGAITAAFGAVVMKTTQLGDTYDKMAKRTNIAVEELSALGYAAERSGADITSLENSMRYLVKNINDVSMGTGEAKDAFEELDIKVTNADGSLRGTMDVFKESADKLAGMTDETKQVALATEIFGRRYGTQLLPLLKEGSIGIEELTKEARELGIVMSTENAAKAAEFNDRLTDLKGSLGGVAREIGTTLLPPLISLAEKAIEIVKRFKTWADENKPLVETIIKISATLGALAAAGGPILITIGALAKLKTGITALGTVSTGPIGLFIVAIGAIVTGLNSWIKSGKEAAEANEKLKASLMDMEDVSMAIKSTEEKIAGLKWQLEEIGESRFLGGDLLIKQIESLEIKLEALKNRQTELKTETDKTTESLSLMASVSGKIGAGLGNIATGAENAAKGVASISEAIEKLRNEALGKLKAIGDEIYEMTHSKLEVGIRDLNREYESYIQTLETSHLTEKELAAALEEVNKWYELKKTAIEETYQPQENLKKSTEEFIEVTKSATETEQKFNETLKENNDTMEKIAITFGNGSAALDDFESRIKKTTVSLSNFTKEGVATAIAQIKMQYMPTISKLTDAINNSMGIAKKMAQYQLQQATSTMNTMIQQALNGLKYYEQAVKMVGAGSSSGGSSSFSMPSYDVGTPYVPETGLALVHKGEKITPANRNANSGKVEININNPTVRNDSDIDAIASAVERVLSRKNLKTSGFELLPGM